MFQELSTQNNYFTNADEKIFTDLRRGKGYTDELENLNRDDSDLTITINIKATGTRKMRLYMIRYFQSEYLYSLSRG